MRGAAKAAWLVVGGVTVVAAVASARLLPLRHLAPGIPAVPTYEVHKVPFVRRVTADGNLRAAKADPVTAPMLDQPLKIAWMAPDGSEVTKGSVVIRFDPTEFQKKLKDGESDHATAAAKIEKEQTVNGAALRDRDRTVVLSEAELEKTRKFPSKDPIVFSRNEIIESQVDEKLSSDRKSHAEQAQGLEGTLSKEKVDLLTLEQQKADIAIGRANKGLSSLEVTAAHDGILVFDPDSAGELPKVGDTKWSGQRIASLPILDDMEVEAFVLEADAGGLLVGLPATVALEADPDVVYSAKIKEVDGLAKPRIRDVPINYFSVILSIDHTDKPRMKPGQRAHVTLMLDAQDALAVPRQSVFEKEGRQVVYVAPGFDEVPVTLGTSSPGLVVIASGVKEGDRIALRDPTRAAESRDDATPKETP